MGAITGNKVTVAVTITRAGFYPPPPNWDCPLIARIVGENAAGDTGEAVCEISDRVIDRSSSPYYGKTCMEETLDQLAKLGMNPNDLSTIYAIKGKKAGFYVTERENGGHRYYLSGLPQEEMALDEAGALIAAIRGKIAQNAGEMAATPVGGTPVDQDDGLNF